MKQLFFVYGTLKRGFGNNRLMEGSKFISEGTTVEKYLFYKRGIPFVSKVDNNPNTVNVNGELYEVDENQIPAIDRLEGHPNWYRRELIDIKTPDNQTVQAWIYFMPLEGSVNEILNSNTLITNGTF